MMRTTFFSTYAFIEFYFKCSHLFKKNIYFLCVSDIGALVF